MNIFLKKSILFLIPILLVLFSGLILPPTPRALKANIFASQKKDSLLMNIKEPRIIFVGGSNLSFGLNCKMIKDSLFINPINTAISHRLGARFILENTLQYLKKGDIIILALEYDHFFRSYNYTSEVILRTVFDVSPEKWNLLSFKQAIKLIKYVPDFTLTKFKISEYRDFNESDINSVNSYNEFGDIDAHWKMESRGYQPITIKGNLNKRVIIKLKEFEKKAKLKGAILYLTFPCFDEISYNNSKNNILKVEDILQDYGFNLLGNPEKYMMPQGLMFNSIYHLNKKGVDYRTRLLINDYKNAQKER